MMISTSNVKAQFHSLTFAPRINLGYLFPVQTTLLSGDDFMTAYNAPPLTFTQLVLQDGSTRPFILQHGGYGFELFYNAKKGPDEYNWSFGGSFFVQKHLYELDVPDFDFKGQRCGAIVDYYRYLAYKLCIRKYWTSPRGRNLFMQLSGIYSNNFMIDDDKWKKPQTANSDFTDNGTGYIVNTHSILKNNYLAEIEFGSKFLSSELHWSVSVCIPFNQYIFKSDYTYYTNYVPNGTVQTKESQVAVWANVSYPIDLVKWTKKEKPPRPPKHHEEEPVIPLAKINDRKLNVQHSYSTKSQTIVIEVFDNASVDGDTASLQLNGTWILEDYAVNKEPKQITIELVDGENSLALYAVSLGTTPPNTAAITIVDGDQRKTFVLNSDYSHCGTLRIYKEP
jgi:hypothetical protein